MGNLLVYRPHIRTLRTIFKAKHFLRPRQREKSVASRLFGLLVFFCNIWIVDRLVDIKKTEASARNQHDHSEQCERTIGSAPNELDDLPGHPSQVLPAMQRSVNLRDKERDETPHQ
jgi:hypothetical protein